MSPHKKNAVSTATWAIIGLSIFAAILIGATWRDWNSERPSRVAGIECSNAHGLMRNLQTMTEWDQVDEDSAIVHILPEYWSLMSNDATKQRELVEAGATLEVGKGRVAVFGEAAMFTAQHGGPNNEAMGMNTPGAKQNYQFVLNLMHWLSQAREMGD